MSGNTFGTLFTVTNFGESHGPAIGCVIDGCPPGMDLCEADIQGDLDRRRPGTDQADHYQQAQARVEDGLEHCSLVGSEIPPEGHPSANQHTQDDRRSPENDQPLPALRAHAGKSSRDFTLVTSSRVENGLVM